MKWAVAALFALAFGCARAPAAVDADRPDAAPSANASAPAAAPTRSARSAAGKHHEEAKQPGPDELTATTRALARARLRTLEPTPGRGVREGIFAATIEGAGVPAGARIEVRLSLDEAPTAYRRRLAFHRLGAALGAHVVPGCVERAQSLEELAHLLAGQPAALDAIREHAAVRNDGTVASLWLALAADAPSSPWSPPVGAPLDPYAGGEPLRWSRWIEAPEREADEVPTLARDWLELIALDYLAATSHRRSVFVVREGGAPGLVLFDNANAFSPAPARTASSALLRRLILAERFPRALRDGLVALTPARAAELLAPGSFETWLLPPRALVELEERRAALLSLIEAKIAGRSEAAVLTE